MNYFQGVKDQKALKKMYKKFALLLHPDKGGSTADFQEMSNQYEKALKLILSGKMTSSEMEDELKVDEKMREVLNKIINLPINIEIVGNWIWCTGNTHSFKAEIKEAGFRFASKKKAWYWNDGSFKKRTGKSKSLDEIKDRYGATKVSNSFVAALN